jgi:outer membrane protein assembly factor BamE (lipoprotein component of BamABCDE complex)
LQVQHNESGRFSTLADLIGPAISCCLGPPLVVRLVYGNYPIERYPNGKITEGMTGDEVVATLGTPHERFKQHDGERWYYCVDSFGMSHFAVIIGPDGRLKYAHGS